MTCETITEKTYEMTCGLTWETINEAVKQGDKTERRPITKSGCSFGMDVCVHAGLQPQWVL